MDGSMFDDLWKGCLFFVAVGVIICVGIGFALGYFWHYLPTISIQW